jgi:hypothetical protein
MGREQIDTTKVVQLRGRRLSSTPSRKGRGRGVRGSSKGESEKEAGAAIGLGRVAPSTASAQGAVTRSSADLEVMPAWEAVSQAVFGVTMTTWISAGLTSSVTVLEVTPA